MESVWTEGTVRVHYAERRKRETPCSVSSPPCGAIGTVVLLPPWIIFSTSLFPGQGVSWGFKLFDRNKKTCKSSFAGLLHLHLKNNKWRETMEVFFLFFCFLRWLYWRLRQKKVFRVTLINPKIVGLRFENWIKAMSRTGTLTCIYQTYRDITIIFCFGLYLDAVQTGYSGCIYTLIYKDTLLYFLPKSTFNSTCWQSD